MHCVVGGHFVDAQCSPQALFTGSVFLGKPWFIGRYHSCGNVHTCLTLSNNRNHCRPAQVSLSRLRPKILKCWWWKILDKNSHIFASDLLNIASNLSNGMQQFIAMLVPCIPLNQNLAVSTFFPFSLGYVISTIDSNFPDFSSQSKRLANTERPTASFQVSFSRLERFWSVGLTL